MPARALAGDLAARADEVEVEVVDGLAAIGWPVESAIISASPFHSTWGNRLFDVEYWLVARLRPTRAAAGTLLYLFGARRLLRLIARRRADVVISTYPAVTEVLGRLRRRRRLTVPVVSAITDLAALRYWCHPGVDLHLVTHPESVEEVLSIAGNVDVVPVRGLGSPDFLTPRDRMDARRALDLPADRNVVVVSGGGWAVGDLEGAVEVALDLEGTLVIAVCGRNDRVRSALESRFGEDRRVRVVGFTDRLPDLLAAADALVHSTAGLTVLEAHVRGCPTISYGWGRAHIRANNRAFARFGLAEVARDRSQLAVSLRRAICRRGSPDLSFAELPSAATVVLARLGLWVDRDVADPPLAGGA